MGLLFRAASLFNRKAKLWVSGRRGWAQRLAEAMPAGAKVFWIHCASLGEFEQGRPVIEAFRRAHPEYRVLLTFFSPSGYQIRKNYAEADYVAYLPLDTRRNARRFLRIVRPDIALFVKYEFWLNYLRALGSSDCRTFIVSAIFRRNSVFFKWYGGVFRRALRTFEQIFVQNAESEALLAEIGVERVTVAGDTRFDRVASTIAAAKQIDIVQRFTEGFPTLVAGSTWPQDEELLMQAIRKYRNLKFIIVPHEIDRHRIERFVEASPRKAVRYTECTAETDLHFPDVLIIDTIGILSSVYRYGALGYIGGGFGAGIHNTLEAAAFGLPLAFGPNYSKFQEAKDLIALGAARSISNFAGLDAWLADMLDNHTRLTEAGRAAADYVASHTGATSLIIKHIG
jgi:3-deoxy-D-manno-octulosonic-acid transferase